MTITVQISRNRRSSPSPSGRRWREAPDEGLHSGDFTPSPGASRHPLPEGEGHLRNRSAYAWPFRKPRWHWMFAGHKLVIWTDVASPGDATSTGGALTHNLQ